MDVIGSVSVYPYAAHMACPSFLLYPVAGHIQLLYTGLLESIKRIVQQN